MNKTHCTTTTTYFSIQQTKKKKKKNEKKSPIHENADASITCDFGDGDVSRLGVAYLTHVIHRPYTSLVIQAKLTPQMDVGPYAYDYSSQFLVMCLSCM